MLWLMWILGCTPTRPTPPVPPPPAFLDGNTPIQHHGPTPVGHYLGPAGVVAAGVLQDGSPFVLVDHMLHVGRDCQRHTRRHGEPVADQARSMTVLEATGWTDGPLGEAERIASPASVTWACGDSVGVQLLRLPGQPTLGWDATRLGIVEAFVR